MPTTTTTTMYTAQQLIMGAWTEVGHSTDPKTINLIALSFWQKNGLDTRVLDTTSHTVTRIMAA